MTFEFLLLRVVHIVGGMFWVGSGLFTSLFLVPALATSGATAGQVMAALQQRRLFTVLPLVAVITIATGLRLMMINSAGFSAAYFASATGRAFAAAGAASVVAFLLALLISRPSAMRAGQLAHTISSAPESSRAALVAEQAALQRRSAVAGAAATTLLVLGAAGMSIARYLT